MRISDWSSDVCSSDLPPILLDLNAVGDKIIARVLLSVLNLLPQIVDHSASTLDDLLQIMFVEQLMLPGHELPGPFLRQRSEEHTSELQSLMRISYAVFCLKKKIQYTGDLR